MNKEQWKPLPGYESLYLVSDQGRVFGLKRAKILKPKVSERGRLSVTLSKEGKHKQAYLHQLVLMTFRGPCPPGMEGAHNDGEAQHNFLRNLRWDTHFNNMQDKHRHGTCYEPKGELHHMHKLTKGQVLEIATSEDLQCDLARRFEIDPSTVSNIKTGRLWGWLTGIRSTRR